MSSCVFYGDLYPNDECYDAPTAQGLRLLMRARKDSAYGPLRDYFEYSSCIGFVRMGDASHAGCVVVISHGNQKARFVRTPKVIKITSQNISLTGTAPNRSAPYV